MYHERALGLCRVTRPRVPLGTRGAGVPARLASRATLIPLARGGAGTAPTGSGRGTDGSTGHGWAPVVRDGAPDAGGCRQHRSGTYSPGPAYLNLRSCTAWPPRTSPPFSPGESVATGRKPARPPARPITDRGSPRPMGATPRAPFGHAGGVPSNRVTAQTAAGGTESRHKQSPPGTLSLLPAGLVPRPVPHRPAMLRIGLTVAAAVTVSAGLAACGSSTTVTAARYSSAPASDRRPT